MVLRDGRRIRAPNANEPAYLVMYHIMYWQDDQEFCPMWGDGWDGIAHHVAQNANIVAATLAPVDKLQAWKAHRKRQRIRALADADSSFADDLDLLPSGRGDWIAGNDYVT